ncbi:MAG: hypothetical protein K8R92_04135 [Planctomycetes bacterium]|nr:hypothetical protein [Planctomycetota bacterium]
MFIPLLALSWIGSCLSIGCGGVLWAFGGRIVHRAVAVAGFVCGIPAGVLLSQAMGIETLPPWANAIIGAFAGLLLALLAYRFALAITVAIVAMLAAGIISAAVIDRGLIASDQARAIAETRAGGFTEALKAVWTPADSDAATLQEQTMDAYNRFWSTLDPPERTLFGASIIAAGMAGLFLGFFMHRSAEMAVTATAGSLLIAWGLSGIWGDGSPRLSAWAFATTVLSFVGFFVQLFSSHKPKSAPAAASAGAPAGHAGKGAG